MIRPFCRRLGGKSSWGCAPTHAPPASASGSTTRSAFRAPTFRAWWWARSAAFAGQWLESLVEESDGPVELVCPAEGIHLPFFPTTATVQVGADAPCRVLVNGEEIGRQGGFDPYYSTARCPAVRDPRICARAGTGWSWRSRTWGGRWRWWWTALRRARTASAGAGRAARRWTVQRGRRAWPCRFACAAASGWIRPSRPPSEVYRRHGPGFLTPVATAASPAGSQLAGGCAD